PDHVLKNRLTLIIQADNFGIKQGARRSKSLRRNVELGKLFCDYTSIAASDRQLLFVKRYKRSDAIPFNLIKILVRIKWLVSNFCQHGLNAASQPVYLRLVHTFQQPVFIPSIVQAVFGIDLPAVEPEVKSVFLLLGQIPFAASVDPHHPSAVLALRN